MANYNKTGTPGKGHGGTPVPKGKKWQKGQSGNPSGKSHYQRITDAIMKQLDKVGDERFAEAGMKMALKGDFNFWKYIYERIEGKLIERLAIDPEAMRNILRVPIGQRMRPKPACELDLSTGELTFLDELPVDELKDRTGPTNGNGVH